jgi:polyisoprenoid-binding protein YceI
MKNETKWSVDQAHTEIGFKVRHLMISHVKGFFKSFDAIIYTSEKEFTTADIDLWIDPASISTGDLKRDEHLQSADFFDVKNHKQITFTSNGVGVQDKEGNHELWGELTIKGISKTIKLKVQFGGIIVDPWGNEKAGFSVIGKINRKDWGLTWNTAIETGGFVLDDIVTITCDVELTKVSKEELASVFESASNVAVN